MSHWMWNCLAGCLGMARAPRGSPFLLLLCWHSRGINREVASSAECHLLSWSPKVFKELEYWAKLLNNMQIPFLIFAFNESSVPFIEYWMESRTVDMRGLFLHKFCVTLDRCLHFKKNYGNTYASSRLSRPFMNLCLNSSMIAHST